ncbi:hypothetical protein [uncultured Phenylobacterium sp.]|uniref:hypothetical protein n=1 Tax=uncultured Phenylobacterium sp. TaxID=349273 RepID=UPI0025EB8DC7|nr:hypothetical protein [uncultured Phenylobacterium sp.]
MTRDLLESSCRNPPGSRPPGPGRLVVTGVVGACVLGVALGIWARPTAPGEADARPAAAKTTPRPALQIVVDDTPAPIGAPLEVLSAELLGNEPARIAPPPAPVAPLIALPRPASGLMKVDAVVAAAPIAAPAVHETPKPQVKPKVAPPKPPKPVVAKASKPEPDPAKAKAKLAAAKAAKAREVAKLEKAAKLAEARKAEKAKAVKLAKAEAARAKSVKTAQAEKAAKAAKLAKAEKTAKAQKLARIEKAKVEAKAKRPAKLTKAVKVEPRRAVRPKATKVAAVKPAPAARPAPKPAKKAKPVPRGEGPMRVARADTCASSDPGEAVVCADRRLSARDRQLQQAYRSAEAAGVPASALRSQQNRWLAARAAAAREAPWAVEDVYVARISELRDLTRDAREE